MRSARIVAKHLFRFLHHFRRSHLQVNLDVRIVPSSVTPPPVSGFQHASYADTFGHISPATLPLSAAIPYATLQSAQAVPYFEDTRPAARKSDIWRMPDRRPSGFSCQFTPSPVRTATTRN
ncbi:hypothetical protein HPB52_003865 [Rhipicephalus sanguineus]|uniref:Uncharacterized protein n=1 Tax=Rhipicephalus sanguineus TaxID=34632 RepID=A0A9D4T584_RHISA|nr:hypothetical protein HPB52_003865 [Rhipicephalus sanguineus]